ncbi:guanine nucleotide-binding protein beta subunit, partial [Reticulomyxa filosa]
MRMCVYITTTTTTKKKGNFLAVGGLDNTCTIWNVNENSLVPGVQPRDIYKPIVELCGHDGYIPGIDFVDDSQVVTCSGDSKIILWNIDKQTQLQQFNEHYQD